MASVTLYAPPTFVQKAGNEITAEIFAKIGAKDVSYYRLVSVDSDWAKDAKVVGGCGGTKKIAYKNG